MISQLQGKKVLFFDIGYTLDMPASGDWMFTALFLREAGQKLKEHTGEEISRARDAGLRFLTENHLVTSVDAECAQFRQYYSIIRDVLETLSKTHRLGLISDTWPSVDKQLEHIGVDRYFSFHTYSCELGVFKPDRRMYLDALAKGGVPAEETVFIDDSVRNLDGAAELGITPILIAANPAADVETRHLKIHDLRELIRD